MLIKIENLSSMFISPLLNRIWSESFPDTASHFMVEYVISPPHLWWVEYSVSPPWGPPHFMWVECAVSPPWGPLHFMWVEYAVSPP